MRRLLNKIFFARIGLSRFVLSAFAFIIGLSLVFLSLQAYLKISEFIAPKMGLSDYVILKKEVGMAHTLFGVLGAKANFSKEDVEDLQKQEFVEDMGVFQSGRFKVTAFAGGDLGFYTELFLESVPTRFLEEKPSNFRWEENSGFLPIIMSQEFLDLYNFGFAAASGNPQLSKSAIGLVPLKVQIEGPGGIRMYNAKIVGFTERINSILVPENFLEWANKEIGNSDSQETSRIMVKIRNDKTASLEKYFDEKDLQVNENTIKYSKIINIVKIVMSVLLFIGAAFILFSLVIVILNFSLIVAEAKEEISLLIQLGYKINQLVKHLSFYLVLFMISVSFVSVGLFVLANSFLQDFLDKNGISVSQGAEPAVFLSGAGIILAAFAVAMISVSRVVKRHGGR
jgi:ABC-type antimicrobial peptide transport system permease subunit